MEDKSTLVLIVPCYNEEEILESSAKTLLNKVNCLILNNVISEKSKILFINDGSKDKTQLILTKLCQQNPTYACISLSRNFGHQCAILAGMKAACDFADAIITIDSDLQQDINAIDKFMEKFYQGNDIVYGVRNDRNSDPFLKKLTALSYYKFLSLLGCDIISNHADYRLMSKKALLALNDYTEYNLYLRGIIPLMGFKHDIVYFDVSKRVAGKSKYTLSKMVHLAIDGITSLSIRPIRIITILGLIIFLLSFGMIINCIIEWSQGLTVPGYATSLISIWFVGGIMLLSLGIIGEYIGRIYLETKNRPRYIIDSIIWKDFNDTVNIRKENGND